MSVAYSCDKCHQYAPGKPHSVELYRDNESFIYEVCDKCFDEIQKLFETPPSPAQPEQVNQLQPPTEENKVPTQENTPVLSGENK